MAASGARIAVAGEFDERPEARQLVDARERRQRRLALGAAGVIHHRGGVRRVALPAAALAALAGRALLVERDVAELAGHRVGAVHQLAVDQESDADAFRHRDGDEVADVFGVLAEPELGQRAGVGGVLEEDGQADDRFEQGPQVHGRPAQVRREHQAALARRRGRAG